MLARLFLPKKQLLGSIHVQLPCLLSTGSLPTYDVRHATTAAALATTTMSNELVEDSEPEREYIRMSQKTRTKGRRNGRSSPARACAGDSPRQHSRGSGDIIDISSGTATTIPIESNVPLTCFFSNLFRHLWCFPLASYPSTQKDNARANNRHQRYAP